MVPIPDLVGRVFADDPTLFTGGRPGPQGGFVFNPGLQCGTVQQQDESIGRNTAAAVAGVSRAIQPLAAVAPICQAEVSDKVISIAVAAANRIYLDLHPKRLERIGSDAEYIPRGVAQHPFAPIYAWAGRGAQIDPQVHGFAGTDDPR